MISDEAFALKFAMVQAVRSRVTSGWMATPRSTAPLPASAVMWSRTTSTAPRYVLKRVVMGEW